MENCGTNIWANQREWSVEMQIKHRAIRVV
jgi:hypothetical protein